MHEQSLTNGRFMVNKKDRIEPSDITHGSAFRLYREFLFNVSRVLSNRWSLVVHSGSLAGNQVAILERRSYLRSRENDLVLYRQRNQWAKALWLEKQREAAQLGWAGASRPSLWATTKPAPSHAVRLFVGNGPKG